MGQFFTILQRFEVKIFVKIHEKSQIFNFQKIRRGCIFRAFLKIAVESWKIVPCVRSGYWKPSPNSELCSREKIMIIRHEEIKYRRKSTENVKKALKMHPRRIFWKLKICDFSWILTKILTSNRCRVLKNCPRVRSGYWNLLLTQGYATVKKSWSYDT